VYHHAVRGGCATAGPGTARFIKALARQTGRFGICVNAVAPGLTDTDMTAILPEQHRADLTETIALRRFGSAADVADLIAFLLSDEASDITGSLLEVRSTISL
jgi:3-oxoacyl-[acyl-carrier protein] reductase